MTTPDFPMPYSLSLFASTMHFYYITTAQRGTWTNAYYRHQLPQGEYMVMVTYTGPDSVRLTTFQGDPTKTNQINLMDQSGVRGTTRTASTSITITEPTGTIQFSPAGDLISQQSVDASTPLVVMIIPQESYKP